MKKEVSNVVKKLSADKKEVAKEKIEFFAEDLLTNISEKKDDIKNKITILKSKKARVVKVADRGNIINNVDVDKITEDSTEYINILIRDASEKIKESKKTVLDIESEIENLEFTLEVLSELEIKLTK